MEIERNCLSLYNRSQKYGSWDFFVISIWSSTSFPMWSRSSEDIFRISSQEAPPRICHARDSAAFLIPEMSSSNPSNSFLISSGPEFRSHGSAPERHYLDLDIAMACHPAVCSPTNQLVSLLIATGCPVKFSGTVVSLFHLCNACSVIIKTEYITDSFRVRLPNESPIGIP